MLPKLDSSLWLILFLIAANLIGIVVLALTVGRKRRAEVAKIAGIGAALTDYFQRTGVKVAADCARLPGHERYIAVIESEPMKRFRLSHMIEAALRDHVRKSCGVELEKVFWRFPIKEAAPEAPVGSAAEAGAKPAEKTDDYINEGLEYYKYIPKVEATELPWEKFEEASTIGPKNPPNAN